MWATGHGIDSPPMQLQNKIIIIQKSPAVKKCTALKKAMLIKVKSKFEAKNGWLMAIHVNLVLNAGESNTNSPELKATHIFLQLGCLGLDTT